MDPNAELERLLERVDRMIDAATPEREHFDVHAISDMWRSMPPDLKQQLMTTARQLWTVRGGLLAQLVGLAYSFVLQGLQPIPALRLAARQLHIPRSSGLGKLTGVQVKQYHRRQQQRGRRPGQNAQLGRQRGAGGGSS